jgi:hypothetical protein
MMPVPAIAALIARSEATAQAGVTEQLARMRGSAVAVEIAR